MKQQNCILKVVKNGVTIDFERFACKKAQSVINQYKKTFLPCNFNDYFFREYHTADVIKIIATPDGYNDGETLEEYTPEQFFAAIL
ncbi:hypothetical protein DW839_30880 [Enterocloster bolteae]|uniref:Uncharacterized protein n=1 Tax=Enterocloster bolteae TaxID=208479 RepID=A0A414AFY7_9FIRM|nr:hypothetical protein DW839_30880 [Enterocloster bolteae]